MKTNKRFRKINFFQALIIVDIQNDFLPNGSLAVNGGDTIIPLVNRLMGQYDLVVATMDWHPEGHKSFATSYVNREVGDTLMLEGLPQILWPTHCVQESWGASLAESLDVQNIDKIIYKGSNPNIDSYSGFFDNGHRNQTGLHDYLQEQGIDEVAIVGLATDYCVKFTALDAASLGYKTTLILDGCRGVELKKGDIVNALKELCEANVSLVLSDTIQLFDCTLKDGFVTF